MNFRNHVLLYCQSCTLTGILFSTDVSCAIAAVTNEPDKHSLDLPSYQEAAGLSSNYDDATHKPLLANSDPSKDTISHRMPRSSNAHASMITNPPTANVTSQPQDQPNRFIFKFLRFHALLVNESPLKTIVSLLERLYDALAFILFDLSFLDEHDLTLQVRDFTLQLHCIAEYLSALAVKAVVRRLGQMLQRGLTGLVSGEVVDVGTAVRTMFVFGVVLRVDGGG